MRLRVALAHAFGCSPVALRALTPLEVVAMADHLEQVHRAGRGR